MEMVLTPDSSGEPGGDAGQGDGAAARCRRERGGRDLAASAPARPRRGRADVKPAGGGGDERGGHLWRGRREAAARGNAASGQLSWVPWVGAWSDAIAQEYESHTFRAPGSATQEQVDVCSFAASIGASG